MYSRWFLSQVGLALVDYLTLPGSIGLRVGWLLSQYTVAGLDGHIGTVNAARFSPDGEHICSCSDDNTLFLWSRSTNTDSRLDWSWSKVQSKKDVSCQLLRGHTADVYDLVWSPDSKYVLSGSVDNNVS